MLLLREMTTVKTADSLAEYTEPALIVPQLRERDSAGVIKELSQLLRERGWVPDVLTFYNAVLNHEFLVNSVTECGIALPHARMNGVAESRFAFGRSREPLVWGRKGNRPVEFVFLVAVPATDAAGFLQLLSALARFARQEQNQAALRSPSSADEIFDLLKSIRLGAG